MTHIADPQFVDLLGLLAGTIGVSIAIWLQLISRRHFRVRYVVAFFMLGAALILMHLQPVWPDRHVVVVSRGLSYVILTIGQLWGAWYIYKASPVQGPMEVAEEILGGDI